MRRFVLLRALLAPLCAVACLGRREPDTPALERMVSMGAAIQNMLLGAHAMGFGAGLTSGKAMASSRLPLIGRAHRMVFIALAASPIHQYSFTTMSIHPRRPDR